MTEDLNTLTELWGEPAVGKTHMAHAGWPEVLHLDTAWTSMSFREMEVESAGERGESWPVVRKQYQSESEAQDHYHYLDSWPEAGLDVPQDIETVVIDNAADLRVLAASHWCQANDQDWPQQQQWGAINDMVDRLIRELNREHHVVVVSQMKAEYQDGDKTGGRIRDGPKRMEFKADFRVAIELTDGNERRVLLHKNRHLDQSQFSDWPFEMGEEVSLEKLYSLAGIA